MKSIGKNIIKIIFAIIILLITVFVAKKLFFIEDSDTDIQNQNIIETIKETEKAYSIEDEYYDKFKNSLEIVKFGNYYKNDESALEPIEWIVLKSEDNKKLLLSLYAIDSLPYHNEYIQMSHWNVSSIREWLNKEFYNIAFDEDEKQKIVKTKYEPKVNPVTRKGNASSTTDNVFMLSFDTCEEILNSQSLRQAMPTEYAKFKGCWQMKNNYCNYWLMEKGAQTCDSIYVDDKGEIQYRGDGVNDSMLGVRPCIWVEYEEE